MESEAVQTSAKPAMDKRKLARTLIGVVIFAILCIVGYYVYEDYYYVNTEDAMVTGDLYRVGARIPGKIAKVYVDEGEQVEKNQVLMELDQQGITHVEDAFIRSPIDGTVIQRTGLPGEVVGAGSSLALVVAKKDLYVQANVEETKAGLIQVGQSVDITIDMYPGTVFHGEVKEIGQATQSVFSLLPATNASGNFTKITQRVPFKIAFTDDLYDLKPGLNAVVKIHIR